KFRGTTGQSQRREIPNTCRELVFKGADPIVFLRDANDENWREVLKMDEARCPPQARHLAVFGVCSRNVESWLCCQSSWIAFQTGRQPNEFRVDDPKGIFESAIGISRSDKKEETIANLVKDAPLRDWLTNPSFADFYEKLWNKSKFIACCNLENLRQSNA
ncbi:MAG TPA: hypothetical protein VN765_03555, partial [Candidatus Acidoferrum sp.]|nr:hypothetical protein [Candidatus Acidoferrum sp.]